MDVDCDDEYCENNVNCDQHVILHLDNIRTINEDTNNKADIGMLSLILSIMYLVVQLSHLYQLLYVRDVKSYTKYK